MTDEPVRVLLVDDSPLALTFIKGFLTGVPDITVVGTARNGKEALAMVPQLDPHVICTDRHMPVMDGLAFVKEVMAHFPRAILVISSAPEHELQELLQAGALGVISKPAALLGVQAKDKQQISDQLIHKIRILARVPMISRRAKASPVTPGINPIAIRTVRSATARPLITAIGASTGGPQVLKTIFSQLPASYPTPILCVQHISKGFLAGLIDWLSSNCALPIMIAQPGIAPRTGVIYFPPEGMHLGIDDNGKMMTSTEPVANGHCPSANVTLQSVAQHYGNQAIGVLLTGMGSDGAEGMKAIHNAGGITLVQDEASSAVFGMPKAAVDNGSAQFVLPPAQIAERLIRLATSSPSLPLTPKRP